MFVIQQDFVQVQKDVSGAIGVHPQVPKASGVLSPSALRTRVEMDVR